MRHEEPPRGGADARIPGIPPRPPTAGAPAVVMLADRLARADVAALCTRVRRLLEDGRARILVCDVRGVAEPSAVTVDVLARIQLTARRAGCQMELRHPSGELEDLLRLSGLSEVIRCQRW